MKNLSRRYLIEVEYDGSNFFGFQRQQDVITVQSCLEDAIFSLTKQNISITTGGRTDRGVHAISQKCHFDLIDYDNSCYAMVEGLNHFLGKKNVGVKDCMIVQNNFHARFSALERRYIYKILNRKSINILDRNFKYHIREKLNLDKMRKAASYLIGTYDFSSFRGANCQAKSAIKTINYINIIQNNNEEDIEIHIGARSFLYHMVRNIVGMLSFVGLRKLNPEETQYILNAKDRRIAPAMAPAHGLYLSDIIYDL